MSFEISVGQTGYPGISLESVNLPAFTIDTRAGVPEPFTFGGESFDLTSDLAVTAIVVGGLAVMSVIGYLYVAPWIRGIEYGVEKAVGASRAFDKWTVDAGKSFGKISKDLTKAFK